MLDVMKKIAYTMVMLFLIWIAVSFVDVLMHNDPVSGDNNYWDKNAILILLQIQD